MANIMRDITRGYLKEQTRNALKLLDVPKYDFTINKKEKFVWFRVPKVGTISMRKQLECCGLASSNDTYYAKRYYPIKYRNYYKFAFVRNPWDRVVSCWINKVIRKNAFKLDDDTYEAVKDFRGFVDYIEKLDVHTCDAHLRLQSELIDLNSVDYLARMESFERDVKNIINIIGYDAEVVFHENRSNRVPYMEYYDAGLMKKIEAIYIRDIQLFGYSFQ